ncbi:MAG: PAC2 family protein [Candidatus Omnitrophica bacterium]|nr:PAC2 family protein [Candidatus Omnitrophota bacterium]MCM8771143.1 PAC2 family protein [Candidatus Omnitrophota bacterium]
MSEYLKIDKHPKLKRPILIVAWPGMGEVAFKAAAYLINILKAKEFARLSSQDFFYPFGCSIQDGILDVPELPDNKFYYWVNPKKDASAGDLIIFLSNAQPDLAKAKDYSEAILSLAKKFKVKKVIGFAAMPIAIEHTQDSGVWFTATSKALIEELKKYNLKLMTEGQISGMNGLFLALAKTKDIEGVCLLGEIPLYTINIENPRAAYAVLEKLCQVLNISLDLSGLQEEAKVVEAEINKLLDYFRTGTQTTTLTPIGEEEIERIKKSLSQYTRLPTSVKEKIEKLFEEAKKDISKAKELKKELDYWSVYKDYEDKFLDLFKKSKEKGN